MKKRVIETNTAPAAVGPYSQAVQVGDFVYTAGQIGLDPETGELADGTIAQAKQALSNLDAVLEAAGSSLDQVVKTTVFLADLEEYGDVNEVYGTFFDGPPPARSAVQVARLPLDARIEIEAVAIIPEA